MTSRSLDDLLPQVSVLAAKLIRQARDSGFPVKVTATLRTPEEQDELYAQGRTAPGRIVTQASGHQSYHVSGRAFDVVFILDDGRTVDWNGPWEDLGAIGEGLGMEWGGRWHHPDRPHFQLTEGLNYDQAWQFWKERKA